MATGNLRITGSGSSAQQTIAKLNERIRELRAELQRTSGTSANLGRVMAQTAQNANMQGAQQAIRATTNLLTGLSSSYNALTGTTTRTNNTMVQGINTVAVAQFRHFASLNATGQAMHRLRIVSQVTFQSMKDGLRKLERALDKVSSTVRKVGRGLRSIKNGWTGAHFMAKDIMGFAGALGDMVKKAESATISLKILENRNKSLYAAVMKTKEASYGLANEFDMITAVNRAASFGIDLTAESYSNLVRTVTKTAMVMGTNSAAMFNDIVMGSARKSKLILDNLGLVIPRLDVVYKNYAKTLGKVANELTGAEQATALFTYATKALEDRTSDITEEMINMGMQGTRAIKKIETAMKRLSFEWVDKMITAAEKLGILNTEAEYAEIKKQREMSVSIAKYKVASREIGKFQKLYENNELSEEQWIKAQERHSDIIKINTGLKKELLSIDDKIWAGSRMWLDRLQGQEEYTRNMVKETGLSYAVLKKIIEDSSSDENDKYLKISDALRKRIQAKYAGMWVNLAAERKEYESKLFQPGQSLKKAPVELTKEQRKAARERQRYLQERMKLLKELAQHEHRTWKPETVNEYENKLKKVKGTIKELGTEYRHLNNIKLKERIEGIKVEDEYADKREKIAARLSKDIAHQMIGQKSVTDFYNREEYDAYVINKKRILRSLEDYGVEALRKMKITATLTANHDRRVAAQRRDILNKTHSRMEADRKAHEAAKKTREKEESTDIHQAQLLQEQSYWLLKEKIVLSSDKKIRKEQLKNMKETLNEEKRINQLAGNILGSMHQQIWSNIIDDKKHTTKEFLAQAALQAGAALWSDGLQNMWIGGGQLLRSGGIKGGETVAFGLAEMAVGAGLGVTGKNMMPSTNTDDKKEKAAEDRANIETKDQTNVVVHQYESDRAYLRNLQAENRRI